MDELGVLQRCQLEILREIDKVCKKNGLTYCLAFGTCLGAVRHKGFIPWDDDIDIYMPVGDLERFIELKEELADYLFLQTKDTDSEYGLMIARVRNSNTTLIEEAEINRDINHGVFIDIYPLFNSPESGGRAKKLVLVSMIHRLMLYGVAPRNHGWVMRSVSNLLLAIIPNRLKKRIVEKAYCYMKEQKETGFVSSLYGDEANIRYKKSVFFPVEYMPFEDMIIPVPGNFDEYLTLTYGDYMELPPKEKRVFHHSYVCVDITKSYKEYKGKLYCKE